MGMWTVVVGRASRRLANDDVVRAGCVASLKALATDQVEQAFRASPCSRSSNDGPAAEAGKLRA